MKGSGTLSILLALWVTCAAAQTPNTAQPMVPNGGGGGGGTPGGSNLQVQYNNAGAFGGYTNTQLTALINVATASLPGALPAWPNTTSTFFRGDATYATLNCAALSDSSTGCTANLSALPAISIAPAANTAPITISGGSITGSSTAVLGPTITGTMNTSGSIKGAAFYANLTQTASGASTMLFEIDLSSVSQMRLDKFGNFVTAGAINTTNGGVALGGAGNNIGFNGVAFLTSPSASVIQLGLTASASAASAQTLQCQGSSGASLTGPLCTLSGSNQTGTTSIGGDLLLQGGTGTSSNGFVRFGTITANIAVVVAGTIPIKDAGGTVRYLMYSAAQ